MEKGQALDRVIATARTSVQNADLGTIPAGRTRPLCADPKVARYNRSGSVDDAANFSRQ